MFGAIRTASHAGLMAEPPVVLASVVAKGTEPEAAPDPGLCSVREMVRVTWGAAVAVKVSGTALPATVMVRRGPPCDGGCRESSGFNLRRC